VAPIRPFLRWAGSKKQLLPRLQPFWQRGYTRYVEPFAGSGRLFFSLTPTNALLADNNCELIETYSIVAEKPNEVFRRISSLPRDAGTYYRIRAKDPSKLSSLQRAVRFIYLNRNCFNGIYRTNTDGQFNVPYSDSRTGQFVSKLEFMAAAELLGRATIRGWDFGRTLGHTGEGDFVYLDPPYAVESRRVFREYGKSSFGPQDLKRLREGLVRAAARGAHFVLSYADCTEARELAIGWRHLRVRVRRHVAGFADARRSAYELLITNII
jgi:DNA adenine methylase